MHACFKWNKAQSSFKPGQHLCCELMQSVNWEVQSRVCGIFHCIVQSMHCEHVYKQNNIILITKRCVNGGSGKLWENCSAHNLLSVKWQNLYLSYQFEKTVFCDRAINNLKKMINLYESVDL